jgi:heptosyltransferase-2
MQRILAVKLADIGDLLTATPALRALRSGRPTAHIAAMVTPSTAHLLEGNDAVDEIVAFPKALFDRPSGALRASRELSTITRRLRATRWDAVVLFHHLTTGFGAMKYAALALATGAPVRVGLDNGRGMFLTHRATDHGFGARHEVDYWLDVARLVGGAVVGGVNDSPRYEVHLTDADHAWANGVIAGLGSREFVIIHPGSGGFSTARRWSPFKFAELVDSLSERLGLHVLVLAGPSPREAELAEVVRVQATAACAVVGPAPSARALAALLGRAALFVGNDSGVMHLAAAMETPLVAIFGPSNHRAWGPYPTDAPRNAVVREHLACSPCIYVGHELGTPAGCPARTCLHVIDTPDVLAAAERALAAGAHREVVTA